MNVKLLKQIAKEVLKRWKQIDMERWFEPEDGAGPCGTTACIAGWALTLKNKAVTRGKPLIAARMLSRRFGSPHRLFPDSPLGLTDTAKDKVPILGRRVLGLSRGQSTRLFYSDDWPEQFRMGFNLNYRGREVHPGTKAYARVVHDRIMHFIKTKGAE